MLPSPLPVGYQGADRGGVKTEPNQAGVKRMSIDRCPCAEERWVRKKDGSLRFCIDYHKFNDATRKDSYPLPRVGSCLDAMTALVGFPPLT